MAILPIPTMKGFFINGKIIHKADNVVQLINAILEPPKIFLSYLLLFDWNDLGTLGLLTTKFCRQGACIINKCFGELPKYLAEDAQREYHPLPKR